MAKLRNVAVVGFSQAPIVARDEHRIALGQYENPGSKLDVVGTGREVAERGERLEHVAKGLRSVFRDQDVVARPQG